MNTLDIQSSQPIHEILGIGLPQMYRHVGICAIIPETRALLGMNSESSASSAVTFSTIGVLQTSGVYTVADLLQRSPESLLACRGIGKKTIEDLLFILPAAVFNIRKTMVSLLWDAVQNDSYVHGESTDSDIEMDRNSSYDSLLSGLLLSFTDDEVMHTLYPDGNRFNFGGAGKRELQVKHRRLRLRHTQDENAPVLPRRERNKTPYYKLYNIGIDTCIPTRIAECGFPRRIENALRRGQVETVSCLLEFSRDQVMKLRNIGEAGADEIEIMIEGWGTGGNAPL